MKRLPEILGNGMSAFNSITSSLSMMVTNRSGEFSISKYKLKLINVIKNYIASKRIDQYVGDLHRM